MIDILASKIQDLIIMGSNQDMLTWLQKRKLQWLINKQHHHLHYDKIKLSIRMKIVTSKKVIEVLKQQLLMV